MSKPVVAGTEIGGAMLTVYRNGFFTYGTKEGTTVYAVDRCAGYGYDGGEQLGAELFDGEEWTVRLMLAGEDRLERNQNVREEKVRLYKRGEDPERDDEIRDPSDFTLELESREALDRMLDVLTERQRQVVEMYFVEGMTQQQIATQLKISQPVVAKQLYVAKKKIRNISTTGYNCSPSACVKWED